MTMKDKQLSHLSDQYLAALRTHLAEEPPANFRSAHELGGQAVAIGLETLDLANVHDKALTLLLSQEDSTGLKDDLIARSAAFFTVSNSPLEKTHRPALEAIAELKQLNEALSRRMLDLKDSKRELQHVVVARKSTEVALLNSELAAVKMLKQSRLVEKQLHAMAYQILTSQEEDRKQMSLQLHDEIGQTLLGIHVRLLALKNEAAANHTGFNEEITHTRHLVEQSVKIINRLACEYGTPHEE